MTTTTEAGDLIKVDCIGRVRTSESQRDALLDAFATSGLSGPEFAARHGVKYQTFATWLQKRKRRTGQYSPHPSSSDVPSFPLLLAEVESLEPPIASTKPLEVVLPGGASISVTDESQLALVAKLIRELNSSC